jgi:putative ABC transport system permease protein
MDHGFKYNDTKKRIYEFMIDPNYIEVLGMEIIAGRNFNPAIVGDTMNSVIINESMANDFGWSPEEALDKPIKGYTNTKTPVVIGVVKDFNFQSLSKKVQPHLFHQFGGRPSKIFIRIKPGNPEPVLSAIQQIWNKVAPDAPFKYSFLDDDLDNFYKTERRWSSIVGWAEHFRFLACLGLFGLAALAH